MTAAGFALIGLAVVIAAVADYFKWRADGRKISNDQLRRITKTDNK